jgi:hypothetical protein
MDKQVCDWMPSVYLLPTRSYNYGKSSAANINSISSYYRDFVSSGKSDCEYMKPLFTQCGVKPNRSNVEESWKKCDIEPKYPEDDLQNKVEELVIQYLRPYMEAEVCGPDDSLEYTAKTSPAKAWKERGCGTKGDALKHPDFPAKLYSLRHVPIVDVNPKVELLPLEDILEGNKIRTTFNPGFDFIVKQKVLFDKQNSKLLENNMECFIKYGFVKQFGGFDDLGVELEKYEVCEESDVQGWDRRIFLLGCYRIRLALLKNKGFYGKEFLSYVVFYTMFPYIACPDGVLRMRKTGNISGSNNTTPDNSIAHLIVCFRLVCELFLKYKDRMPTLEEITKYHYWAIYSDDCTGAHNLSFYGITLEEFMEHKRAVYAKFNLFLKPKQTLYTYNEGHLDDRHSFLGSSFCWNDELKMYIPYPRIDKLASSLKFVVKKNDIESEIAKTMALCVLSSPIEKLNNECSNYLNFLFEHYQRPLNSVIPIEWEETLKICKKNPISWLLFYLGRETKLKTWNRFVNTVANIFI